MAVATKDVSREIVRAIGANKIDDSKPTLIAYRIAHGQEAFLHDLDYFTPGVVVWPESVTDVRKIVQIANETEVPIVPVGGRTGSYGAEAMKGCIVVDLARMNKVIEFDEKKLRFTAEAGIRIADLTDYLANRGYMLLDIPSMTKISLLGSRAALHGYNKFENRWGSTAQYIKGLEIVLPTGEVIQVGRGTNGLKVPSKSVVGYNLMDLFIGSRGTLGIITKVMEKVIRTPRVIKYDAVVFKTREDGIKAYVDLKNLNSSTGSVWRVKGYHQMYLMQIFRDMLGQKWPEDIEWLTEYFLAGESEIVEATEKYVLDICRSHHGFWREDLPPKSSFAGTEGRAFPLRSMEEYLGSASVGTKRVKNGGVGNRMFCFDPNIPDTKLGQFYDYFLEHLRKMKDGKTYPHLADCIEVLEPPSPISADEGFNKLWATLTTNWEVWNAPVREEFLSWFREYAEIVWKADGSLSATHGFIPRELEIEFIKREFGENEYKLMAQIKDLLDPNHIMNPKVKFEF